MPEIAASETDTIEIKSTETEQPDKTAEKSEVDWKARAREWEKRAKANAEAAAKLAELEESQKSEAQKLADAKVAADQATAEARAEALRWRIAAKHGISDEDAELFLSGADEETLTKQAVRLAERVAAESKPRTPRPDPNQGRATEGSNSTADQFASTVGGMLGS